MLDQIKLAIGAGILVLVGLLSLYCWQLKTENTKLIKEAATAVATGNQAQAVAVQCSNGVVAVQTAEQTNTKNAQVAVAEAKKDAQTNYTNAAVTAQRKPTEPVISIDNVKNFGGTDALTRMQDYYATQDLFNEAIDRANGGDAK